MGYCFRATEVKFYMPFEKQRDALKAVKEELPTDVRWVRNQHKKCKTIEQLFNVFGMEIDFDEDSNIIDIVEFPEKLGDELMFFQALGPYVAAGSYIECSGEDGSCWRWAFNGASCREIHANISWDEEEEE
jgi:hypothetical protein